MPKKYNNRFMRIGLVRGLFPVAGFLLVTAPFVSAATIPIDLDGDDNTQETLEIYGVVRLSLDYGDSDLGDVQEDESSGLTDGSVGISSNTSLIGFRGSYTVTDSPYKLVWQVEQRFNPDNSSPDTWSNRDSYLGMDTPMGLFRVGLMDSPYKTVGATHALYSTTVGDFRTILGRGSREARNIDLRGSNSIYWTYRLPTVRLDVQYAADQETVRYTRGDGSTAEGTQGVIDDNGGNALGASATYEHAGVTLSLAYAHYSEIYGGKVQAWRTGAKYSFGPVTLGAILEDMTTDEEVLAGSMDRMAYGLNAQYKILPKTTLGAQWIHANESDYGDDSADNFTLAVFQQVFPRFTVHLMATTTRNDDNGRFRLGEFAHGDKIATVPGGNPFALSLGSQLSF